MAEAGIHRAVIAVMAVGLVVLTVDAFLGGESQQLANGLILLAVETGPAS